MYKYDGNKMTELWYFAIICTPGYDACCTLFFVALSCQFCHLEPLFFFPATSHHSIVFFNLPIAVSQLGALSTTQFQRSKSNFFFLFYSSNVFYFLLFTGFLFFSSFLLFSIILSQVFLSKFSLPSAASKIFLGYSFWIFYRFFCASQLRFIVPTFYVFFFFFFFCTASFFFLHFFLHQFKFSS